MDEKTLIRQAKAGNRQAFDELVRQHRAMLLGVAIRIAKHPADAEDLVQEALLRAWQALPRFSDKAGGNFRSWAARIVTNLAISHYHARHRAARAAERMHREFDEAARTADPSLVATGRELLGCLPVEFRETVVLYAGYGYSYQEVATALGIALGTVMSRLHRARARLARAALLPPERSGAFSIPCLLEREKYHRLMAAALSSSPV